MRVLVDTSAWADYFNAHPTAEREALRKLIAVLALAHCPAVRVAPTRGLAELLAGAEASSEPPRAPLAAPGRIGWNTLAMSSASSTPTTGL